MIQGCRSFLVVLCALAAACQPLDPSRIPQAKPAGWVVDLSGLLAAEDIAELERLGDAVHAQDGAALMVLTIDTTGGKNPRGLATEVFNRWRLGDATRDNGILILVAPHERAAEIVLGDGIDSEAEVATSDRVMQEEMLPRFREGRNAAAIVAGAHALAASFFGLHAREVEALPLPARPLPPRPWRLPQLPVVVAAAALLLVALAFLVRRASGRWLSSRPRACPDCRAKMIRLSEADDDRHLERGQQTEERIGSRDYEVWSCIGCGLLKTVKGTTTRSHARCPQCGNDTARSLQKVLPAGNPYASGVVEVETVCAHCGYTATVSHPIEPLATPPSPPPRPEGAHDLYRPETLFGGPSREDDPPRGGRGSGGGSSGRGSSGRW